MEKRLERSETNKVIAGVCGGIGEYFDVDPVFVRILAVISFLASGFGIIAYIVAWIIMPKSDEVSMNQTQSTDPNGQAQQQSRQETKPREYSSWNRYLPGLILVGIGLILLIRENWYWFDFDELWPVLLVIVGLLLIFRRKKKNSDPSEVKTDYTVNNNQTSHNGGTV